MAGAWRDICAGGTGDLLDLVSDDGLEDLTGQRRGGSGPLREACRCPASLPSGQWRLNRRVLPVPRYLESDALDGYTRKVMDRRALVLGGGGVTGIAWEIGVIAGLADRGIELAAADVIIGNRRFMDGGVRSVANADLAASYQRVVIVRS
jgi:hypothetical protein